MLRPLSEKLKLKRISKMSIPPVLNVLIRLMLATLATLAALQLENENIRKLEALKLLYGEQDSVPFTDQELAEHKIDGLRLREDRDFVHRKLKGIYGEKRLILVIQYFDEWQKGSDAETNVNKIENSGRYRANTWMRDRND